MVSLRLSVNKHFTVNLNLFLYLLHLCRPTEDHTFVSARAIMKGAFSVLSGFFYGFVYNTVKNTIAVCFAMECGPDERARMQLSAAQWGGIVLYV